MVIECAGCKARYRFKKSMLKGFKGAEVRCRKCGGMIVVVAPGIQVGTPEAARVERRAALRRHPPAKKKTARVVGAEMAPSGPVAHGQERMEAPVPAGMALIGEISSPDSGPDNAPRVDLSPEVAHKQPPSESHDISGMIRTDPVRPPPVRTPAGEFHFPSAFSLQKEAFRSIPPGERITGENERSDPISRISPIPSRDDMEPPDKSSSDRSQFQIGFPVSMGPRPSHVAIVYLLLLLLGGCGYLIVRFLANIAGGGV